MHGPTRFTRPRARASSLLASPDVARRIAAFFAFFAVVALAAMLLYRVYMHHERSEPLVDDEGMVVRLDVRAAGLVKITQPFR